jgi:hypothetical protein
MLKVTQLTMLAAYQLQSTSKLGQTESFILRCGKNFHFDQTGGSDSKGSDAEWKNKLGE